MSDFLIKDFPEEFNAKILALKQKKQFSSKKHTILWILEQYFSQEVVDEVKGQSVEAERTLVEVLDRNTTVMELVLDRFTSNKEGEETT
ncbi:MAG: hypothetical protein Q4B80_01745 [Aerococcaceae bacterium]|nr:hypothetical protein [Aerococcaceae bacterium]